MTATTDAATTDMAKIGTSPMAPWQRLATAAALVVAGALPFFISDFQAFQLTRISIKFY